LPQLVGFATIRPTEARELRGGLIGNHEIGNRQSSIDNRYV
jgi:hypothetical protein